MADTVVGRLRDATDAELRAFAKILDVEIKDEREVTLTRLSDAFEAAAGKLDLRQTLLAVAAEAATQADWKRIEIKDSTDPRWIEEYIHRTLAFVHRPDRARLSDVEKAQLRERAEQALEGKIASPREASNAAYAAVGAALLLGIGWGVAAAAGVVIARSMWGPNMKKVLPATLVLIHIRKRGEFESVLQETPRVGAP